MAVLGIDYGAKKIGLAKSDELGHLALPLTVLIGKSKAEVLKFINESIKEHSISTIVVGVPISLSSGADTLLRPVDYANKQMQEVLGFIDWLKKNVSVPVAMEDERLSTKLARGLRKDLVKQGPDDAVAAMLVLQSYLDKQDFKS